MQGPSACICEVKFLFPLHVQANPELTGIWAVGQRIWQRDFPGIYTAIAAFQWSENILPVMEALRGKIKSNFSVYKYVTFDNHCKGKRLRNTSSAFEVGYLHLLFMFPLRGFELSRGHQISTLPTMRQTRSNNGSLCFPTTISVSFVV